MNPKASESEGGCFDEACALALAHNNALNVVLKNLDSVLKGFKYCNSNFYNWLQDRIDSPSKYGMYTYICIDVYVMKKMQKILTMIYYV